VSFRERYDRDTAENISAPEGECELAACSWRGGCECTRGDLPKLSVRAQRLPGAYKPHLAERLNSLVTQSGGIALSSPSKLDNRFGYHCHCGIIAIDQTQLTDCILEHR
jgi:hypothetical protein